MIKTGRVIRIFDDENLVVNLGASDGVTKGATLSIFAPPVEIKDPETDENLGTYHHPKANVRAERVSEKFCVAGPFPISRQVKKAAGPTTLFQQFQTEYRTEPGELNIEEDEADPLPSGSAIRVGDPVYITLPDKEDEPQEPVADTQSQPRESSADTE